MSTAAELILAESLRLLEAPDSGPRPVRSLRARRSPVADPAWQLQRLLDWEAGLSAPDEANFSERVAEAGVSPLNAAQLDIFQVNLGKLCNMTCRHCHVDAGPDRTDAMMSDAVFDDVLAAMARSGAHTLDITGGAPELHPRFRELIEAGRRLDMHVMDRCNLTILLVRRFEDLPQWLAAQEVEIVASLPHVRARNTDAQRGEGTYDRSIEALRRLNEVGYGQGDPARRLTLVSNPAGAFLGASQTSLEGEWKQTLVREFGVGFDRLLVLNNMPVSRYLEWLIETGNFETYMERLLAAFNPATIDGLMCRNTLSVSWDGRVFDCDFNQMLDIEAEMPRTGSRIADFDPEAWLARRVVTAPHCFGCTAGAGSGCGGQTA